MPKKSFLSSLKHLESRIKVPKLCQATHYQSRISATSPQPSPQSQLNTLFQAQQQPARKNYSSPSEHGHIPKLKSLNCRLCRLSGSHAEVPCVIRANSFDDVTRVSEAGYVPKGGTNILLLLLLQASLAVLSCV